MTVRISRALHDQLLEIAAAAPDREVCGLLFGCPGLIESVSQTPNISNALNDSFEIDPATLIAAHRAARGGGPAIIGHFHSHPNAVLVPSQRDRDAAAGDGALWLIIAGGQVAAWRSDRAGALVAVALEVGTS